MKRMQESPIYRVSAYNNDLIEAFRFDIAAANMREAELVAAQHIERTSAIEVRRIVALLKPKTVYVVRDVPE